MANWDRIMEAYESNDCESLGEYAAELMNDLADYFEDEGYYSGDIGMMVMGCAMYFINVDRFVDGGEEDVLRYAINDFRYEYNFSLMQRDFDRKGYASVVEGFMRGAPYRVKEMFARLGCCVCSGKGYISSDERRAILRWV